MYRDSSQYVKVNIIALQSRKIYFVSLSSDDFSDRWSTPNIDGALEDLSCKTFATVLWAIF